MTVLRTLRMRCDVEQLREFVAREPTLAGRIMDLGAGFGMANHRIWVGDGEVLAVDEWPSEEAFRAFLAANPEVEHIVANSGVQGEGEMQFWEDLLSSTASRAGADGEA